MKSVKIVVMIVVIFSVTMINQTVAYGQEKSMKVPYHIYHPTGKPYNPKNHPVGKLSISTEIPATLFYDDDNAGEMSSCNQVVIVNSKPGPHILTFRTLSNEYRKKIVVDSGATCYYKLRKDSLVSDSIVHGNLVSAHPQKIANYYIPFVQSFTLQFRPGYAFKTNGSGFDAHIIGAYYFNQKFSLGLGTGYNSYSTHMVWSYINTSGWFDIDNIQTTYFQVCSIPVFVNISLYFVKQRFTPFLSFSGGLSFPVTGSATGSFTGQGPYYLSDANTHYFRIDQMNMGVYFGIDFGCKYTINPMVDMGLSFGFDMNFNTLKGKFYDDPYFQDYVGLLNYTDIRAAFCIRLVVGLNLNEKTIHQAR